MTIKNETIKKLTHEELNNLGAFDLGIICIKGIAKTRKAEFKTTLKTETEIHYTNEERNFRIEMVRTADTDFIGWAFRYYDMNKEKYEHIYLPLIACDFVK